MLERRVEKLDRLVSSLRREKGDEESLHALALLEELPSASEDSRLKEVKRSGSGRILEATEMRGESRFAWMDAEYLQVCWGRVSVVFLGL